jgi:hypothetical protein
MFIVNLRSKIHQPTSSNSFILVMKPKTMGHLQCIVYTPHRCLASVEPGMGNNSHLSNKARRRHLVHALLRTQTQNKDVSIAIRCGWISTWPDFQTTSAPDSVPYSHRKPGRCLFWCMYSISIETCYTLVHHYMAEALSAFSEVKKVICWERDIIVYKSFKYGNFDNSTILKEEIKMLEHLIRSDIHHTFV